MPKPGKSALAAEEVKQEEEVKDEETQETEETTAEETASTETAAEETPTEVSIEEDEPTAAELQSQLAEKDAEIARLKSESEAHPAVKEGGVRHIPAADLFWNQILPAAKKAFTDAKVTPEIQFDVMVDTANKMMGAVLADKITPNQTVLATTLITTMNKLDLAELKSEFPQAKTLAAKILKTLEGLTWDERSKDGAVAKVYNQLVGESSNGKKAPVVATGTKTAAVSKVLRDVSAVSSATTSRPSTGMKLSTEQESERVQMEQEQGTPYPASLYLAKLKARQDKAKAQERPIPKTLLATS